MRTVNLSLIPTNAHYTFTLMERPGDEIETVLENRKLMKLVLWLRQILLPHHSSRCCSTVAEDSSRSCSTNWAVAEAEVPAVLPEGDHTSRPSSQCN